MLVNIHTHHPRRDELTVTSAGIHPWDAAECDLESVRKAIDNVDAVGEIGLDKACDVDMGVQTEVFRAQILMAQKAGKPVILHCVRMFEPMMKILGEYNLPAVIFHGFLGSAEQMLKAVDKGYYLSYGFRTLRSPKTALALKVTPERALFLETDESERPIVEMYAHAAAVRRTDIASLEEITNSNLNLILHRR